MEIITGIKHHGKTGEIRFFSGYFLHAVQQHMKIQGERYYNEGKGARNQAEKALGAIWAVAPAPEDQACDRLADLHALLKAGTPKTKVKKAACKAVAQSLPGLFDR